MKALQRMGYAVLFVIAGYFGLERLVNMPIHSNHSPEVVLDALETLDIRKQPGEPGSTAESAGGILPEFRVTRSQRAVEWKVMSDDLVAITMTARVESGWLWGSWIEPEVVRGNAPDARTSPAFQSRGITLGLLRSAIGDRLDLIGSPGWGDHCEALHTDILAEESGSLFSWFAINRRLEEGGCDYAARPPEEFKEVSCAMCDAQKDPASAGAGEADESSGFKTVSPY